MGKLLRLSVLVFLVALTVVAAPSYGAEVVIGTGTASWNFPLATWYHDARTQIIYLASEIGGSCQIAALSLDVTTVPGQTMNNFTIRMKHTTLSSYSVASWESTGWTTVYQANQSISGTGWQTFAFTTPFEYNGSDNLMVDISFNNSSFSTDGQCRYSTPSGNRAIYYRTDSGYGDPLTWSGASNPTPSTTSNVPNVKLTVEPLTSVIPPTFSPDGGTYTSPQCVTMSCISDGAVIHYTTDGSTPTCDSATYTSCVPVNPGMTLKAIACKDGMDPSLVKSAVYSLQVGAIAFSPDDGTYTSARHVAVTCPTPDVSIHYTTNGDEPGEGDLTVASGSTVLVDHSLTLKAKAFRGGWPSSDTKRARYFIRTAGRLNVDKNAPGPQHDGFSWDTAFLTVAEALHYSISGDEIWVAKGTYGERVTLNSGVALYGGFVGTETNLSERPAFPRASPDANAAILDGNQGGSVVTSPSSATASTVIDGFTIRNGYGTLRGSWRLGGGIYCSSSPTISNNTITANTATKGGGIHCDYPSSSPTILNNTITANSATWGGGVYCVGLSATISNNTITANTASWGGGIDCGGSTTISNNAITANSATWGGGISCAGGSSTISNNTITGNTSIHGGGISCQGDSSTISNNTITANSASGDGGGIFCLVSSPAISNNVVAFGTSGVCEYNGSGTQVLKNNCVYNPAGYNYQGLSPGSCDFALDPLFADGPNGNYHLRIDSPCVAAGDNAYVTPGAVDMDGEPRILPVGGTVDVGADEYSAHAMWLPGEAKRVVSDGQEAYLTQRGAMVATAKFAGWGAFYMESVGRSSGIQCRGIGLLNEGQCGIVHGIMDTLDGERVLTEAAVVPETLSTAPIPSPLLMGNKALGGGTFGLQEAIFGSCGLNNVGLLVRTWGRIVERDPTWFTIDDGSGVNVKCLVPSGVTINPAWSYVGVTGVSSCETVGNELHSLLRVRTQSDIVAY